MIELRWLQCDPRDGAVLVHWDTWAKLQWRQQTQIEKPTPFGLLSIVDKEWTDWQDVPVVSSEMPPKKGSV